VYADYIVTIFLHACLHLRILISCVAEFLAELPLLVLFSLQGTQIKIAAAGFSCFISQIFFPDKELQANVGLGIFLSPVISEEVDRG
jgi:hypothetical protein